MLLFHMPFINFKGAQDIVKLNIAHFLSPLEDEEEIEKSLQHQMLLNRAVGVDDNNDNNAIFLDD